jgi:hypothetical protein
VREDSGGAAFEACARVRLESSSREEHSDRVAAVVKRLILQPQPTAFVVI